MKQVMNFGLLTLVFGVAGFLFSSQAFANEDHGRSDFSDRGAQEVSCQNSGGGQYVPVNRYGDWLGQPLYAYKYCMNVVNSEKRGSICAFIGGNLYAETKIESGRVVGAGKDFSSCVASLGQNGRRSRLSCESTGRNGHYVPVNRRGDWLGQPLYAYEYCMNVVNSEKRGSICAFVGNNRYAETKVRNGRVVGAATDFPSCVASIGGNGRGRRSAVTCQAAGGNGRYVPVNRYGDHLGQPLDAYQYCMNVINSAKRGQICAYVGNLRYAETEIDSGYVTGTATDFPSCVSRL